METSVEKLPGDPGNDLEELKDDEVKSLGRKIYRIGCLQSDGSGFLHAYVKTFSAKYNSYRKKARESLILSLRAGSAARFAHDYPDSWYAKFSTKYPKARPADPVTEGMDLSITGIVEHLMTTYDLSPFLFEEFSRIFHVGVIFVIIEEGRLKPLWVINSGNRFVVFLPTKGWRKFDLVALKGERLQTTFGLNDPFIKSILN